MDKIILSITAVTIILFLLLASYWSYQHSIPSTRDDILYVMRISRIRLWPGIVGFIFFSAMDVISILYLDTRIFIAFAIFYIFTLWSVYFCLDVLLWRGIIRADSLTFHMPLLPPKEIKFCDIDFVHCTDSSLPGFGIQKTLAGYHSQKKLFSIEEDISGFSFLYALFCEYGKLEYVPVLENPKDKKITKHVPAPENFSVTAKPADKIRSVSSFLIIALCFTYFLWDQTESNLFYLLATALALPVLLSDMLSALLWKVTIDFHSISVRNSLGIVKTYEIRQITKVVEMKLFIILYTGEKKAIKISKGSRNFQYLFERLLHTEIEIYKKY